MAKYYVRIKPQITGYNAVHKENCPFIEDLGKKILLGEFGNSDDAVAEAKRYFQYSKGCLFCASNPVVERNKFLLEWNMLSFS